MRPYPICMPISLFVSKEFFLCGLFGLFIIACQETKPPVSTDAIDPLVEVLPENQMLDTLITGDSVAGMHSGFTLPYDLVAPVQVCKLPGELEEVSGLGYMNNGNLALIQDEKGKIYSYSFSDCKIEDEWKFARNGDYEGIEIIEDTAWMVTSAGTLYKVVDFSTKDRITQKFKTALTDQNDVEGLGYIASRNELLLACKDAPYLRAKQYKGKRAVYAFNTRTEQLSDDPYLLVNLAEIDSRKQEDAFLRFSRQLAEAFDGTGSLHFQPSGIAEHPITHDLYVIASVGKLLLIFDSDKQLIAMHPLSKRLFKQPEGLCFSPKGDLYISNEGKGGKATILKFQYTSHDL